MLQSNNNNYFKVIRPVDKNTRTAIRIEDDVIDDEPMFFLFNQYALGSVASAYAEVLEAVIEMKRRCTTIRQPNPIILVHVWDKAPLKDFRGPWDNIDQIKGLYSLRA